MQVINSGLFRNVTGGVTPFNLTEYAYSLSKATGISIQFKDLPEDFGAGAMVNIITKTIYLPRLDYTKTFDPVQFRKIKSFLNHECAHLLFPDNSYTSECPMSPSHNDYAIINTIARTLDDIRIEALLGNQYRGIKEDFKFLIDQVYQEVMERCIKNHMSASIIEDSKLRHGLYGDFSDDLLSSFYWQVQKYFRKASLRFGEHEFVSVKDLDSLFETRLIPLIKDYIDSTVITSFDTAKECLRLLKEFYPHAFEPPPPEKPSSGASNNDESTTVNNKDFTSEKSDNSDSEQNASSASIDFPGSDEPDLNDSSGDSENSSDDQPEGNPEKVGGDSGRGEGSFEELDSPSAFSPDGDASASSADYPGDSTESISAFNGDIGEIPDIDIAQVVKAVLHKLIDHDHSHNSVGSHFDIELDIMDRCFRGKGDTDWGKAIYNYILKEYKLIIQRAKIMFERILLSEQQSRDLITFSGKFTARRAAHVLAKPINPRVYQQTTRHDDIGFDISILLDMSGSMGCLQVQKVNPDGFVTYRAYDTFAKIYPVMVTLAHSLSGIKGVNLEILGFSADIAFHKYGNFFDCSKHEGANNIYVIKPFDALNLDDRLNRLTGLAKTTDLFHQNFDIGALKIAASRLARYSSSTGNRRLLIVLSDGQPASSHTRGIHSTKLVIQELESQLNIFGIGLGSHSVEALYSNSVVVADLSQDLLEVILNRLCQFVMHGR
jgi:cobalamin biosynthesis protein CobT